MSAKPSHRQAAHPPKPRLDRPPSDRDPWAKTAFHRATFHWKPATRAEGKVMLIELLQRASSLAQLMNQAGDVGELGFMFDLQEDLLDLAYLMLADE
jgi:hypothetical protein